MMAMSFKRDIVEGTSLVTATTSPEERPESNVICRGNDASDCETKMPLHSGLSALIQAATSQLSRIDDRVTVTTTKQSAGRRNSAPARYTPHGFHTTPIATTTFAFQDGCSPPLLSSTLTTPTLGPESASEVRKPTWTFPEALMKALEDKSNADVITFLPDGKYFAVRRQEFSEKTMRKYFDVDSFDAFLDKIHSWGFSRIDRGVSPSGRAYKSCHARPTGIEIFRHPLFVKGDWEKCSRICFGESPTEVRLSALPDRARIEYTLGDEHTLMTSKRRLSPSHVLKEFECSTTTSKQRLSSWDEHLLPHFLLGNHAPSLSKSESVETTTSSSADASTQDQGLQSQSLASKMEDDIRSLALAITTEKLNLQTDDNRRASIPLVERGVENATHTIVTDAIETLLRDEDHTRETYLKHERELSRSSLPGVVPISKQLFSTLYTFGTFTGNVYSRRQEWKVADPYPPAVTSTSFIGGIRPSSLPPRRSPTDPPAATNLLSSNNSNNNAGVVR